MQIACSQKRQPHNGDKRTQKWWHGRVECKLKAWKGELPCVSAELFNTFLGWFDDMSTPSKQFAQNLTTPYKYLQILQNSHFIISSSRVAEHPTMVSPASGSISLNKFIEICQIEARKNIWYLLQRTNLRLAHYEVIQTNDWINWSGVDWQLCLSDAEPASSWSWESKIELKSKKNVMIHQHSHVFFFHAWDHGLAPQLRQLRIGLHLLRRSGSCAHHVMPICQIKDFQPFQFELFSWDISGCNKAKMEIS